MGGRFHSWRGCSSAGGQRCSSTGSIRNGSFLSCLWPANLCSEFSRYSMNSVAEQRASACVQGSTTARLRETVEQREGMRGRRTTMRFTYASSVVRMTYFSALRSRDQS